MARHPPLVVLEALELHPPDEFAFSDTPVRLLVYRSDVASDHVLATGSANRAPLVVDVSRDALLVLVEDHSDLVDRVEEGSVGKSDLVALRGQVLSRASSLSWHDGLLGERRGV